MSLLDDLANLDLSAILNARLAISASVGDDGFKLAVSGDFNSIALGDLASLANQIKSLDPKALGSEWEKLLEPILSKARLDQFPIAKLLEELRSGLDMGSSLIRQFASDPLSIGTRLDLPLIDVIEQFKNTAKNIVDIPLDEIQGVRDTWKTLQTGLPTEPIALAEHALGLLLPFPVAPLKSVRNTLNHLLEELRVSLLPESLIQPLKLALQNIQSHAASGDQAALDLALAAYPSLFLQFQTQLNSSCQAIPARIAALPFDALVKPAKELFALAQTGQPHALKFMEELTRNIKYFESLIAFADEDKALQIFARVNGYLDSLDTYLQEIYLSRIDQGIEQLKQWVRDLFSPLRLKDLEREIDLFFDNLVDAINQANIGQYAETLRKPFKALAEQLDQLDLGQHLDDQLAAVGQKIAIVTDTIKQQLQIIDQALNALAGEITAIFQQVSDLLAEFGKALEQVNAEIEKLDIEGVSQEVISALQKLREKGEELLAQAPIPEPMRPLIQQLIKELEKMDLEALIKEPAHAALASLDIPAEIKAPLQNAMPELQKLLDNVHPDRLTAQLQAELAHHVKAITDLAQKSISGVVDGFFKELKKGLDVLDPSQVVKLLRIPYEKILAVFDNLNPELLLKPATDAYDQFLANLPLADPAKAASSTQKMIGEGGKAIGQAAAAPVKAAANPGSIRDVDADEKPPLPEIPQVRPGDMIRQLLGKPMAKLHEILSQLPQTEAAKFLSGFQSLSSGLASDLRSLRAALGSFMANIEHMGASLLNSLADTEFEAGFTIESQIRLGNLQVNTQLELLGDNSSTNASSSLSANLALHQAAITAAVREKYTELGETLDAIADLLETHPISLLSQNLTDLLNAVDPEPLAAALDSLANAATAKFIELSEVVGDQLQALFTRIQSMIRQYNPALHLQRLSEVIAVFWEEMRLLNPHYWVGKTKPIHLAILESLADYDPAVWTGDLVAEIQAIKAKLTTIDPAALLDPGQLNPFQAQANSAATIDFTQIGTDLKTAMAGFSESLKTLDPAQLLSTVDTLKARMVDQLDPVVDAVHQELLTLLKSLKYISTQASASVSVSA